MNVVIPMAGLGSRFKGFDRPKPLIFLPNGKTLIENAVSTLNIDGRYIFITRKYDNQQLNKEQKFILKAVIPDCLIIELDFLTEGPACSALMAGPLIHNDQELVIANCDQIMRWDSKDFLQRARDFNGCLVTYSSNCPSKSYAKIDENGLVQEVKEKEVISNYATNGIHYWRNGKSFVESSLKQIQDNTRTNNEFYIAPTYNYLINERYSISIYHLMDGEHVSVGDPDDFYAV